ncbi:3-dehydroquinate synthase [Campylobacter sp. MIT 21-1685]|uniref:3-dehydroquinate synthase n=1 Tax=unclassified Campylobacter TaxID=2593542 RepID=UPI00224B0965|nr:MULTISPECIES: 3-dehydroquinate synthase [unclassified Campylobacter]MCX2682936.1 3-dehydroquinate synthase [Campylobacter sp. MIT 21-1684]MCX2751218.1 3-dehydroquinate synthase [Campylobacter sp. MIT 21-1682]MCX2807417.1 3-dehydroquinate synthase [Campylobacter sp. MIT 21-1685]
MQIPIHLKKNSYKVFIDEPLKLEFEGKVALVSNAKVAGLHLQKLLPCIKAEEIFIITIKDGEEYKNIASIEEILKQMFLAKLDRKSTLISFGGGVISDMCGFAASIYQRGIDFINIPTTLLACVDAAVGGKTGINNEFGKNLIGTFYQPKAVYCQSEFLRTLTSRELSAGLAECIKMAVIFDDNFFDYIHSIDAKSFLKTRCKEEIFTTLLAKSIELKAMVVTKDEKENGMRMLLNYGHTFAHIIENQTQYKTYLHGQAVAIGMNMANRLAFNLGLLRQHECERIQQVLEQFQLPTSYTIKESEEFYQAFFLDKKTQNNKIHFVLPVSLGKGIIKSNIDKEILLKTIKEFQ